MAREGAGKSYIALVLVVAMVSPFTGSIPMWNDSARGLPIVRQMSTPEIQAPLLTQKVALDGGVSSQSEWSDTIGTLLISRCSGNSETLKLCGVSIPGLTNFTIWAKHDGKLLYFLYQVPWPQSKKSPSGWDGGGLEYHWSQNGIEPWEHGDLTEGESHSTADYVWTKNHTLDDYSSYKPDIEAGCRNNVVGSGHHDGKNYWFEFAKPLDSGDGCDWVFRVGNRYGAMGIDGVLRPYFWHAESGATYMGQATMSILSSHTVTTSVSMTPILLTGTTTTTRSATSQASQQTTSPASSLVTIPLLNPYLLVGFGAVVVISSVVLVARRRKALSTSVLMKQTLEPPPKPPTSVESSAEPPFVSTKLPTPGITPEPTREPRQVIPRPGGIISSGYAELDGLLAGGFPERYAVLIASPSYDERDLIMHKIIETNLSSNIPTYYVSSDVRKTEDLLTRYPQNFYALCSQADKITPAPAGLYKIGGVENLSDFNISVSTTVRSIPVQQGFRKIMIIDTLSDVVLHHKLLTTRRWLSDFLTKRKADGFTVFATFNPLIAAREEVQTILDSFDGVIEIFEKELKERSRRFLVIRKMYGRKYSESELMLDKDKLF